MNRTPHNFCTTGKEVLAIELNAIQQLEKAFNEDFHKACEILFACQGRVIVIGIGKSGHIANKIASTLASTGTPAFFIHPAEASHGDLGMITKQDVVIMISSSGYTEEILDIIPLIKRLNVPLISLTGNPQSTLAKTADININISVEKEACPLNLAPTASTTATLVMGDALAIALLQARGFTKEDFAFVHPKGSLGKRLLLKVSDIMHTGSDIPKIQVDALLSEALIEMSQKKLGLVTIVDKQDKILGVFTDGDLRRTLEKGIDFKNTYIKSVMTQKGITVKPDMMATEALYLMEKHKIIPLLVVTDDNVLVGAFNIHDLLRAGIV
jgi:arabinose-5-phosphate isomerase